MRRRGPGGNRTAIEPLDLDASSIKWQMRSNSNLSTFYSQVPFLHPEFHATILALDLCGSAKVNSGA
jgi:hypothetical protein